eukprot:CAMPEP_0203681368 /NCGR_PEP_ID=MMETSP0090-20130426/42510_1 /ASSEMBLY_ACC=CAM_ASM_001088 /TAXON_ID=426623 /ORGANISM="Chaetoceros affinis, Strain CCMP159" /LENGTH=66 /DNA_ID=CAMNT_0050549821 /DNA_START=21 /DNA_END=217 /DNA_ORIENTATION=-
MTISKSSRSYKKRLATSSGKKGSDLRRLRKAGSGSINANSIANSKALDFDIHNDCDYDNDDGGGGG